MQNESRRKWGVARGRTAVRTLEGAVPGVVPLDVPFVAHEDPQPPLVFARPVAPPVLREGGAGRLSPSSALPAHPAPQPPQGSRGVTCSIQALKNCSSAGTARSVSGSPGSARLGAARPELGQSRGAHSRAEPRPAEPLTFSGHLRGGGGRQERGPDQQQKPGHAEPCRSEPGGAELPRGGAGRLLPGAGGRAARRAPPAAGIRDTGTPRAAAPLALPPHPARWAAVRPRLLLIKTSPGLVHPEIE